MKRYLLLLFLLCTTTFVWAQVGIGTTTPSAASVLDVNSRISPTIFGGMMPPRVTLLQRGMIAPTATDDGLMIFLNEGNNRCFQIWDGVQLIWKNIYCIPIITNIAPVATLVTINGTLQIGETLTANFTYTDADSDPAGMHNYNWFRADNISGLNAVSVQNGTSNTYVPVIAGLGKFLRVQVTPVAISGVSPGSLVNSAYRGPIAQAALASWEFEGTTGNQEIQAASPIATNIQGGVISRGTGITAAINGDRYNAKDFTQPDLNTAILNNDYFQFTITPSAGRTMTIEEIFFNYGRSATGPSIGALRSSVDNYAANLDSYTGLNETGSNRTTTITTINNINTTVTFRLYLYGNTNGGGTGGFEGGGPDLIIRGTTN